MFRSMEIQNLIERKGEEPPLSNINEINTGQKSNFLVYHGSDKPFTNALPSELHPLTFYTDTEENASTYSWGNYIRELDQISQQYDNDTVIGAKILLTEEMNFNASVLGHRAICFYKFTEGQMQEDSVLKIKKRLDSDETFLMNVQRLFWLWNKIWEAQKVGEKDATDFETKMGSVSQYLVTTKNPKVIDFERHTWGDLPGENGWTTPKRSATTEQLREEWNNWLNNFFNQGYDVIIVKNIKDIGFHFQGQSSSGYGTIAVVSQQAKVDKQEKFTKVRPS